MRKLNTTLDREPMTSMEIRDRQDFNYILKETAAAKVPIWKSIWFYGPVGIAMVTMVVSAVRINPKNEQFDKTTTLAQNDVTGWTGSNQLDDLTTITNADSEISSIEGDLSMTSAVKGSIPYQAENSKTSQKSTSRTDNNETSETNTELKPEVLTEENIKPENTRGESDKSLSVPLNVVEKKAVKTMPNIAGVFNGRLSVGTICSTGKIDCNNGFEIISYDIQYDNGAGSTVDRVSGSEIPSYICRSLRQFNVGSPVFITRIVAMNQQGERKQLLSMNIEPTF